MPAGKITEPSGINRLFPLPEVLPEGILIRAVYRTYKKDKPVLIDVQAGYQQRDVSSDAVST